MKKLIVVAAAVALLLAGCSDKKEPAAEASPENKAIKYAQCMREHGVPMEDPQIDGDKVQLTVPSGAAIDPAKAKAAEEACKQYSPINGGGTKIDPSVSAQMVQYAQCMRQNGVEKF